MKCKKCGFNPAEKRLGNLCWLCFSAQQVGAIPVRNLPPKSPKKLMCKQCRTVEAMGGYTLCWLCSSKNTLKNAPKVVHRYIEVFDPKKGVVGHLREIHGSSMTDLYAEYGKACMLAGLTHFQKDPMSYDDGIRTARMIAKKPAKMLVYKRTP